MIGKRVRALFRPLLFAVAMICIASPLPVRADTNPALERFNRRVFEMNKAIMDKIVRPAKAAYQSQAPLPAQQTVRAVYDNLLEPVTATAYMMVGDIEGAAASTSRFAVNSTLGLLGATLKTLDLEVAGDTAYEVGEAQLKLSSGQPATVKYVVVWRKGGDGVWRMHRDIWNAMPTR